MITYFDTSAVVKLVIEEPGSGTVERVWLASDAQVCATIGLAEAAAALGRAGRAGRLSRAKVDVAVASMVGLWSSLHRPVVDDRLVAEAAELALRHDLRGFDAVHLAAAIAVADTFVAADQRLLDAARASGLATVDVAA